MLLSPLVLALALATLPHTPPEVRREPAIGFAVDTRLQDAGGLQYFFALGRRETTPLQQAPFDRLRPLLHGVEEGMPALHVLTTRIVFTVDRDAGFFTAERATDPDFLNAVIPEGRVEQIAEATFRTQLTPANTFKVRFIGEKELAKGKREPAVQLLIDLAPELGTPVSVVTQDNYNFDRVIGVRTAAWSVTWTGHYRLPQGRTRVVSYTLSLVHNLPPFFLGGDERVHQEARKSAVALVEGIRRVAAAR